MLPDDPPYRDDRPVGGISVFDPRPRRAGVHDPAAAQIQRHMSRIANNVAGLRFFIGNFPSRHPLRGGITRDAVAVLFVYRLDKSGAVRPVRQARPTCYIRIAYELAGIRRNVASAGTGRRRNRLGAGL